MKKTINWKNYLKLLNEWDRDKNSSLNPEKISKGSHKIICWTCSKNSDHEWVSAFKDRILKRSSCPFCAGRKVNETNCLQTTHPEIAKEWNNERNAFILPVDVTSNSNKKIWWICINKHEWLASCANRSRRKSGCPYCNKKIATFSTSFAQTYPEIAKQWHPTKNELKPTEILPGSAKKIWWQCSKDAMHEWQATCNNRVSRNKTGCPHCNYKK